MIDNDPVIDYSKRTPIARSRRYKHGELFSTLEQTYQEEIFQLRLKLHHNNIPAPPLVNYNRPSMAPLDDLLLKGGKLNNEVTSVAELQMKCGALKEMLMEHIIGMQELKNHKASLTTYRRSPSTIIKNLESLDTGAQQLYKTIQEQSYNLLVKFAKSIATEQWTKEDAYKKQQVEYDKLIVQEENNKKQAEKINEKKRALGGMDTTQ
ncbi:hypothetical protein SAMD00019534_113500, partial [Acytostelium subglobosum LB1]|uniref:hypothetical protein n=1 Tax=Acytostelium subglobosum LB1 TaxID=1410327 RepID=UPI000644EF18